MSTQSYQVNDQVSSPQAKGTNGLAIVSLVIGILWMGGIGAILALILGIVSLNQISRSGQSGKGLAIAGIVLGSVGIITLIVLGLTYA